MEERSEAKSCQNCKKDFTIEPDGFAFYEKMKVPAPTWCPKCRAQRRLAWRDFRVLYKRKSDWSGETIFSIIHPDSPYKVYEKDIWFSDKWDPMEYEKDYDFSKPFFEQLRELSLKVPRASQTMWYDENSDYCSGATGLKNCYLTFVVTWGEDCMYSAWANNIKNCIDTTRLQFSEYCYESFYVVKSSKVFFSTDCEDCVDIWFSKNLQGCMNCIGCVNLRNKQYHIFNQPYSKEEYKKKFAEFDFGSAKNVEAFKEKVEDIFSKSIVRFAHGKHNFNISGEYINNSKNVRDSYYVQNGEDCRYIQYMITPTTKDAMDVSLYGQNIELIYEVSSCGEECSNIKLSYRVTKAAHNCTYCMLCNSSSNLFGCVGLQQKQYCIFNKQYTRKEYEELVPKIIKHMDEMPYVDVKGRTYKYGEFFPPELAPFAYNETVAADDFPITKQQALDQGFRWQEAGQKDYKVTLESEKLSDNIKDVTDDILKETMGCAHKGECACRCTTAFKITKQELDFYRFHKLPIPHLCHNCRHVRRVKNQSSMRLWHRKCMNEGCNNEFETSYAPDRSEIVYCEQCYQQEII